MKIQIYSYLLIIHILYSSRVTNAEEEETDADLIDQYTQSQKEKQHEDLMSNKIGVHNGTAPCRCVKYYECNVDHPLTSNSTSPVGDNTTAPTAGSATAETAGDILGIVDVRIDKGNENNSTPNGCHHYFDICCFNVKSEGELPTPGQEEPKLPIKNLTNWVHKECGHRNEKGIGFQITGATEGESQFGEFPWTVAIVKEEVGDDNIVKNVFLCGGSLIHPQVVVTAAHCVFQIAYSLKKSQLKVRAGEWDTQTLDEPFPHQDRYVKKVVIHEQIYRKGLFNDIALLFLEKEVKLAPNVDTLCLPPLSLTASEFEGRDCFSSGWGKDNFGAEGRYKEIMKKVQVPIVSKKACESQLRKTRLGDGFRLHDSFICAGGGSNDTCVGDGGSPLVCKLVNSENYVQLGIVSWGIGCGSESPGVYVNVRAFVPWILDKMREHHFDDRFATFSP